MTLNAHKCEFRKSQMKFLGHVLDSEDISVDPTKTEAIRKMQPPGNTTALRLFLGMVNQLAKFLPGLPETAKPMRELLQRNTAWVWPQPQQETFNKVKEYLTSTPMLAYYNLQKALIVSCDASLCGVGVVLLQVEDSGEKRPAKASRPFSVTEQEYVQMEEEALAVTLAYEHFRIYLPGKDLHRAGVLSRSGSSTRHEAE